MLSNNRNAQQGLGMNTDRLTKRMQKAKKKLQNVIVNLTQFLYID
jgi:hypothetical protein